VGVGGIGTGDSGTRGLRDSGIQGLGDSGTQGFRDLVDWLIFSLLVFMKARINRMWVGTLFGILVPVLALVIYQQAKFEDLSFLDFLKSYFKIGILTHVISLAVIPNLLLFFGFVNTDNLKAARGVLLSTFIFAFTVLILRFS